MIATLNGTVGENLDGVVVLEVGGVGYGLHMTTEDQAHCASGTSARVYIYEHIREQSHDLFGFLTRETKKLFELLLDVNGVGPKMALNILSIGTTQEVRSAIAAGNLKYITAAQGVGKRVAERVVVELKDKVGLTGVDLTTTGMLQAESHLLRDEAAQALVALGYDPADAAAALSNVDVNLPVEDRIKQALKK